MLGNKIPDTIEERRERRRLRRGKEAEKGEGGGTF